MPEYITYYYKTWLATVTTSVLHTYLPCSLGGRLPACTRKYVSVTHQLTEGWFLIRIHALLEQQAARSHSAQVVNTQMLIVIAHTMQPTKSLTRRQIQLQGETFSCWRMRRL